MRWKSVLSTTAVLMVVVGLAGCAGASVPAPSLTLKPTPTATATPTPSVSPSAAATATSAPTATAAPVSIPDSCDDLGTATTRQQTVGNLTAQHSDGFVRPSPANATVDLSCNWIEEGSAGVLLIISTASPSDVQNGLASLASQRFECQAAEDFGAQYCVQGGSSADTEDVVVARDGTWIYLETVNVNARAWLSEIAEQIFS